MRYAAARTGQRGRSGVQEVVDMVEFLSTLANAIVTLFHLIINSVAGIVQFFAMLPQFLTYLATVFAYVPAPLVTFLSIGVTFSVILLIIARN